MSHDKLIHLLYVEDDNTWVKLLKEVLQDSVFEMFHVKNVSDIPDDYEPDIAILDLVLPETEGEETIEAFQRKCPNVPFIVFTAHDVFRIQDKILESGADYVAVKGESTISSLTHMAFNAFQRESDRVDRVRQRISRALSVLSDLQK